MNNTNQGHKEMTEKELLENFKNILLKKLYLRKVKPLIKKGLCACIYTQVSDVEEEINGLVTYDRAVQKVDTDFMKSLNAELEAEANKIELR